MVPKAPASAADVKQAMSCFLLLPLERDEEDDALVDLELLVERRRTVDGS